MTTDTKSPDSVWDALTLTGMTVKAAYDRIDADLGPKAYSEVIGVGAKLTDIKPPFLYEVLSECFGPMGLGWGFSVTSSEYIGTNTYTTKTGKERTEHEAVAQVIVWYSLADGVKREWGPIPGGASNEKRWWAESGAVTNAVGKAFSFLGAQRHIYKNSEAASEFVPSEAERARGALTEAIAEVVELGKQAKFNGVADAFKAALGGGKSIDSLAESWLAKSPDERSALTALAAGTVEAVE